MLIKVTQEDIDRGKPSTLEYCPVALAIKRIKRKRVRATSYGFRILVDQNAGKWRYYNNPSIAKDWIEAFDNSTRSMTPFQFEAEFDHIIQGDFVK